MKRVGLIGAGRIAPFYLQLLSKISDLEITVAATLNSQRARELALKFGCGYNGNAARMIEDVDYLIIACDTRAALGYVKIAADSGVKKILCEKPLFTPSNVDFFDTEIDWRRVYVAYNRRFYDAVQRFSQKLRDFSEAGRRKLIHFTIPESLPSLGDRYFALRSNGVHMVDLARYMLGGFEVHSLSDLTESSAILSLSGERHSGLLVFRFNANVNTEISFDSDRVTYRLCPIERYSEVSSMEIMEAIVDERTVRSYSPIEDATSVIDDRLFAGKPGFQRQLEAFLGDEQQIVWGTVEDARDNVKLVETIVDALTKA